MYWEDKNQDPAQQIPDDVMDLVYSIRCRCLPVDHTHELAQAVLAHLSWLQHEDGAGIHPIHVADSGNGWMRPENPDDLLHLSRRTKLILRLPKTRLQDARALVGQCLQVAGNAMEVVKAEERLLSPITTLFSRYIVTIDGVDEEQFLNQIYEQLQALGIKPPKMLPGREHKLRGPEGDMKTRSLMVAGLTLEESVTLQQRGLGTHQHLGCGLFIPHKDITEVGQEQG